MISPNDKIEKGELKLQSFAKPPLVAKKYTLSTKLTLTGINNGSNVDYADNSLCFTVSAPRFALELGLIYSVYPASGSSGPYHKTLPHIVFTRKTLPWEREIVAGDSTKPWLALLLLTEEEIKQNSVSLKDIPIKEINSKSIPDLLTPTITIADWESEAGMAKVLEMPVSLFQKVAPKLSDLSYLAHTRQVDTGNKENNDLNPKGWFSVIVGNRRPKEAENNYVFLVSMEGQSAGYDSTNRGKKLLLGVLKQWSFLSQGHTFSEICEELGKNVKPFSMEMESTNLAIQKAFKYGYSPLNHQLREGKKTISWYRGPLVPVDIPNPEKYQYESADQALRFDRETAMFDISYSSAWQLGRLLALQSPSFFTALNNWKMNYEREKPLSIAKKILKETSGLEINPEDLAEMVHTTESDEILSSLLFEFWT